MPDFFAQAFEKGPEVHPAGIFLRLALSMILGGIVTWIYRFARPSHEVSPTFPTTLILLSVLICMVTQVIGDNVARAFSLVGALSIVRFRTVVRDTQDTAYVIFAVVVGMSIGAKNPWVAVLGLVIVGVTAFVMKLPFARSTQPEEAFLMNLRVGLGLDLKKLLHETLAPYVQRADLLSVGTVKQGMYIDVSYEARLHQSVTADEVVKKLNQVELVQSVQLQKSSLASD
ncbi:MAG: hypothetical protein JWN25_3102 [Verrucomicrobiales bacterium]|nr:hypothetical protein [Verrucomicrobiales bacterium]MDB6129552.1 hypothetical protein [Verrucomicrobiales bacterium]